MPLFPPYLMTNLSETRRHLKRTRIALSAQDRAAAAAAAIRQLAKMPQFRKARRIATYLGSKGELDPTPLIAQAKARDQIFYLPVLHPFRDGHLLFCHWTPGERLIVNRYGIPEPVVSASRLIPARNLDLVIVPLLGFDPACHRLGMGGGYYDRSFAFVRRLVHITKPFLLGFAHESQRLEHIALQPWDVALNAVVTNRRLYLGSGNSSDRQHAGS